MLKLLLFASLISLAACTDAIPQVTMLDQGSKGIPIMQKPTYVDTNLVGNKTLQASGGYTGQVMIHSGTALAQKTSAGGYKLEIRHLSF